MSYAIRRKVCECVLGVVMTVIGSAVSAEELPQPSGDVLLTVSGAVAVTQSGDVAQFDREMLEEVGETSFTTTTIWTEGSVEFTGVPLADLLKRLGIESGTLKATAINDYAVEIPVADALTEPAIIAYKMNGAPMSVREKGPLWIVYPYDADENFQSETYYSRSIWQLDRIVVQP
ncbi:putative pterin-binding protein [Arenibacterium sp. CAU 1754]